VRRWKLEIFEIPNGDAETSAGHQDPRLFIDWSGTGLPPWQIVWDGRDVKHVNVESATSYEARFTWWNEVDERQELSAKLSTGLLIRKEGDKLKISVSSVIFRANHADFTGLPASVVENNYRVVAQIARILRKYPDYHIRIEGHANNVGKMIGASPDRVRKEELEEVWPLSTARARKIHAMLVAMGVDPSRLYIEGFGSSEPRFSFTDEQNRWKNRRVEFVLIRP
ncbi:MAG: OmpA family protein, partial [Spirochaetales bacterium]|nr:OmpA family protein [Spirochaetales bacterium]